MNTLAGIAFFSFLLSMIFFITAEVLAVMKLKRKDCTATRAFLWFEVLGFISVSSDYYKLYDRGSEKLKDCEKTWWDALSEQAENGVLYPEKAWQVIKSLKSEHSVRRFIFLATVEKWARILGLVSYTIALAIILMSDTAKGWVWGSLLIALWNIYKLYYVYGVFRPLVKHKVYAS
jgi:hypothetical protein